MLLVRFAILLLSIIIFFAESLPYQGSVKAVPKCPERTEENNKCKKRCTSDNDCKNKKHRVKKCLCDGACGLSCIRVGFNRCPKEKALATRLRRGFLFLNGKTYKDKESFEFRDELKYKCKKGFTLSGPSRVVCSGIGKWKPLDQGKPVCRKECKKPQAPKNGHRFGKSNEVWGVVRFRCNSGYQLQGPVVLVCLPSLQWNAIPPKCQPQDYSRCGQGGPIQDSRRHRIYGGTKASNINGRQWPWHIAIFISTRKGFKYHCGGSLIRENVVLTAAHCIIDWLRNRLLPARIFRIVVGEIKLKFEHEWLNSKFIQVKRIFTLPSFHPTRFLESDIAIMELMKPKEWSAEIRPVCLPSPEDYHKTKANLWGFVSGFGINSTTEQNSEDLRYTSLKIQSDKTCSKEPQVEENTFCAGILGKTNDACKGDAGGPFVLRLPDDRSETTFSYYLMGIVSHGPPCGGTDGFGFFTKVSVYLRWINEKIAEIKKTG